MKFITFLFTLIITTNSFGQNWDFNVQSTKGNEYFLDMKTIKQNGSMVSYNQLANYPDGIDYNGKLLYSIIVSRLTDCVNNKFKTTKMIGYSDFNGKGQIIVTNEKPTVNWVVINMDKITGDIQREVCK
jgi:hypothetical protein